MYRFIPRAGQVMRHRLTDERQQRVRRYSYIPPALMAIFFSLVAVLLLGGCGSSPGGGGAANVPPSQAPSDVATTWMAQNAGSGGSKAVLTSVNFVDTTHGWAVGVGSSGHAPIILATTDGGATWKAQDAGVVGSKGSLYSVSFVDARHGWAVGASNTGVDFGNALIIATTDGGATWKAQDISGADGKGLLLYSVNFVDASHGWAVGVSSSISGYAHTILATTDGGATWKAQDAGSAASGGQLNSVYFVDAKTGWAVGFGSSFNGTAPVILATTDGGTTWKAQDAGSAASGDELNSVSFVDATHGWVVGSGLHNGIATPVPVILATSDGGVTWKPQDASSGGSKAGLKSVSFVNANDGWAVGDRFISFGHFVPLILATTDGGTAWKAQDASSAGSRGLLHSVNFVDASHGWTVGVDYNSYGSPTTPVILATSK